MSWITERFAEAEKKTAEALEKAEREAIASGKELFDLATFERILNRGPQASNERAHRYNYYISHAEFRTLVEYAAYLHRNDEHFWSGAPLGFARERALGGRPMTSAKLARTTEEMRFAAELEPCAACGTRELGELALRGQGSRWSYEGVCPKCGTRRVFEFTTASDPTIARAGRFDLGAGPSRVIAPEQFLAVFDEASPQVPDEPSKLAPAQRREAMRQLTRALTSVTELLKLVPSGGGLMHGASDARLERKLLEREFLRLGKLVSRYRPASSIDQATLDAHVAWLKRGGSGAGRLELTGKRLTDEWYGPINLTFAFFVDVDLTNVELADAILDEAEFARCTLHGTNLDRASLTNATINSGDWSRVRLATAKLNAAQIAGTTFAQADLDRSYWYDAKVKSARFDGARFGNAVFDRALFERCSFREATFGRTLSEPEPTSRGAQFIECDFTGVSFADRDLRDTAFVRCVNAPT